MGDTVTVDVFFDATEANIEILRVGILNFGSSPYPGETGLAYDPVASAALPVIYPAPPPEYGTQGHQPGYILYSIPVSMGASVTALYPDYPNWRVADDSPPGVEEILLEYTDVARFNDIGTRYPESDIWIASLVFVVEQDFGAGALNYLYAYPPSMLIEFADGTSVDPGTIEVSAPIVLAFPEPMTGVLLGLGVAVAAAARAGSRARRRAR